MNRGVSPPVALGAGAADDVGGGAPSAAAEAWPVFRVFPCAATVRLDDFAAALSPPAGVSALASILTSRR